MLIRELTADHVYLACGHTDMRKSIDGLASIVQSRFQLNPHQPALFLFCGRQKDRIKGLLWDETGFLLLHKRLENGHYQWPDKPEDLLEISAQQLRWLTEGLSISQPRAEAKSFPEFRQRMLEQYPDHAGKLLLELNAMFLLLPSDSHSETDA